MLTVRHLYRSRSTRVLWLLDELELPYMSFAMTATRERCWLQPPFNLCTSAIIES